MPCVANYCPVISRIRLAQGDIVAQAGPPAASERGVSKHATPPHHILNEQGELNERLLVCF